MEQYLEHPKDFRILAGLLAAGGIFWGLLCLENIDYSLHSLIFIPGYIITVGYIVRCFYTPRLFWLRVIWGSSAIVQGAWLVWIIAELTHEGLRNKDVNA